MVNPFVFATAILYIAASVYSAVLNKNYYLAVVYLCYAFANFAMIAIEKGLK